MNDQINVKELPPSPSVELLEELSNNDLNDLCDATDDAIEGGGGFGWIALPNRERLEGYWRGVLAMPARTLFVARLDGVICGTCQLWKPPAQNEAQAHAVQLTTNFVAPWARGHGLAKMLLEQAEAAALDDEFAVINLDVRETHTDAIKLYESMGYVQFGAHPYSVRLPDQIVKSFYYYKVIDPAAVEQEV
ncbi:MAG: GNAT family N-acetyltransferase [Alphaproteobacteria bacterium]|nr:GNAT family N-acetyltransferase [Alphaproteobacteria bacterium]